MRDPRITERQLRDAQRSIARLKKEKRELEREIEDRSQAWVKFMPGVYAEALVSLDHIAHNGVKGSDDPAGPPPKPESRPPTYDRLAMTRLRSEKGHLAQQGKRLGEWLDQYMMHELPEQKRARRETAA